MPFPYDHFTVGLLLVLVLLALIEVFDILHDRRKPKPKKRPY